MRIALLCLLPVISIGSTWETTEVLSDYPLRRSGHSLTGYKSDLYLFGGCDLDTICYNALEMFNITEKKWVSLETSGVVPKGREGHISVLVGSYLYVYGGTSLTEMFNDVHRLDFNSFEWEKLSIGGTTEPRAYHAGVLHDHGLIIIFGGYTSKGLNDELLLLDTVNQHWGHPVSIGLSPSPRKQHSLSKVSNKIWLFGGETDLGITNDLWYYEMYKRHWFQVSPSNSPSQRHGHAVVSHGSKFFLFGGCNNIKHLCYSDLYTFTPDLEKWEKINDAELPTREAHALDFASGILYVFAGRFLMEKCYNDFWEFQTDEPCPDMCSNNGNCIESGCDCFAGWSGVACEIKNVCRMNCNGHGSCQDFICICYPGYYGTYCQGIVGCPLNCTSGLQGVCLDSSECSCFEGYTGEDCSLLEDWKLCEDLCINGNCEDLECICESGWIGNYCDIEAPIIFSASADTDSLTVTSNVEDNDATTEDDESDGVVSASDSEDVEIPIKPSSDIDLTEEGFENITSVQDISASNLDNDKSLHLIVPEMFGFTDPADPTVYYAENLRRDPEDQEKEEWIEDLEAKQDDRLDDISSCIDGCSFHGTCYSAICYCESGYTGEKCEIPEEDIDSGIKFSDALIAMVCMIILGCCVGGYFLNRIMKAIKLREESNVKEAKNEDDD